MPAAADRLPLKDENCGDVWGAGIRPVTPRLASGNPFAVGRDAVASVDDGTIATFDVGPARDFILVSVPSDKDVGPTAAEDPVFARAAGDHVSVSPAENEVVPCASRERVVSGAAANAVTAAETPDEISLFGSQQGVSPRRAADPAVVREIARASA